VSAAALRDEDGALADAPADALADALLRVEPVLAVAVPGGGATRSTWPTSSESGFDSLFQRVRLSTDVRLLRAILYSVSPRSTR
jgi:hypothetical protein